MSVTYTHINQPSLPTPFYCSCIYFCLYGPFNCISFHKFSQQLCIFSLCSSGLISALLVLSTLYLFMKVFFSPDIIPSGWLGSKHQLTNCRIPMHGRCHGLPCLNEFSSVVLSYFTLSRQTTWKEMLVTQPEDSLRLLFKAIDYSRSWVRKLVNSGRRKKQLKMVRYI